MWTNSILLLIAGTAVASQTGGVSKRAVQGLPLEGNFAAVAVAGKVYAFKTLEDDQDPWAELAQGGDGYVYDPGTGQWEALPKMPVKKANFSLATVAGRIYAVGGMKGPGAPCDSLEEFNPARGEWTARRKMPTARGRVTTLVAGGKIYALGGKVGERSTTAAVEAYDPETDTWQVRRKLAAPAMGISAAVVDGRIYKLKGTQIADGRFSMVMDFEVYDPAADTWTKKAEWTYQREPLEVVEASGRLFVVGAGVFSAAGGRSLREYDIAGDRWIARSDMPAVSARTIHPGWVVVRGKIYVFGGGFREGNGWRASDHALRYDPAADRWDELPAMADGKIGMGVAAVGNRILIIGGERMETNWSAGAQRRTRVVEEYATEEAGR